MNRMLARTVTACLVVFLALAASAHAARAPDFAPAVRLSPPLPHPHYSDPDAAVRNGRAVAVWTRFRPGTKSFVQATEIGDGGRPGPVSSIFASPDSGFTNDPVVALSSSGRAAVVWDGGPGFLGVDARLAVFDADLVPGPTQTLGKGYDPTVRYPADGGGLLAWSSEGGVSVAPIDPFGVIGNTNTIPVRPGTFPVDPTLDLGPAGGRIHWITGSSTGDTKSGLLQAEVDRSGDPGSVRTIMRATWSVYRNLVVSRDLLVALQQNGARQRLICVPLGKGGLTTIDSGPAAGEGSVRAGSVDVDASGDHGLIGWVKNLRGKGSWTARAATVNRRCEVSRTTRLPPAGRRAYDTEVGHEGRSPFALVAGGGGLESVDLSRSGRVRSSKRIANTRPFSKKADQRTPVTDLELVAEGGRRIAIWTQSDRGPGQTIAASIAR